MSVQVPEAVQWLLELVVGEQWPDGSEDALRDLGRVWSAAADQLDELRESATGAATGIHGAARGSAADAFAAYWSRVMDDGRTTWPAGATPAALPWSAQFCRSMARSCDQGALEIETAKLTIIANLVVLAATLAPQLLIPGEGEAAVAAEVPIARAAAQVVLREAVEAILAKCLEEAVTMALIQAGVSLGVQLVEVAQGNRRDVDWHAVATSAEAGGLGGALGAGFGGLTGLAGRTVGGATEDFVGSGAGRVTTAVVGGVATNLGTDLVLNGRVSLTDLAGGIGTAAVVGSAAGLDGVIDHGAAPADLADPAGAADLHDTLASMATLHNADGTVRPDLEVIPAVGSNPDIRGDLDAAGLHTGLSGIDPAADRDSEPAAAGAGPGDPGSGHSLAPDGELPETGSAPPDTSTPTPDRAVPVGADPRASDSGPARDLPVDVPTDLPTEPRPHGSPVPPRLASPPAPRDSPAEPIGLDRGIQASGFPDPGTPSDGSSGSPHAAGPSGGASSGSPPGVVAVPPAGVGGSAASGGTSASSAGGSPAAAGSSLGGSDESPASPTSDEPSSDQSSPDEPYLPGITTMDDKDSNGRARTTTVAVVPLPLDPRVAARTALGAPGVRDAAAPTGAPRSRGTSGTDPHPDLVPRRSLAQVRAFDRPGGLKQVEPEYQRALEAAVPRDSSGAPIVHPAVDHAWVDEVNDGGPAADPGRATNCVDGVRAGLATYYGDPQAAAARLPESDAAGRPSSAGETDGVGNMEAWAGARYRFAGSGRAGLAAVEAKVRAAGPGASAAVVVTWPSPPHPAVDPRTGDPLDPGSHQVAVVNDRGDIRWIDFQTRAISPDFPYPRVEHVWSIALDADRNPILDPAPQAGPRAATGDLAGGIEQEIAATLDRHDAPRSADPGTAADAERRPAHYAGRRPDFGGTPALRPMPVAKEWTAMPDGGMSSPDGNLAVTAQQYEQVRDVRAKAVAVERRVTPILLDLERRIPDARLVGLDSRLKTTPSLCDKFLRLSVNYPTATAKSLAGRLTDVVRYTVCVPDAGYVEGTRQGMLDLMDAGYEPVGRLRNTWGGARYRGINSLWKDPDSGVVFEVQFHTPDSFWAKEDGTHDLYEEQRRVDTPKSAKKSFKPCRTLYSRQCPFRPARPIFGSQSGEGSHG